MCISIDPKIINIQELLEIENLVIPNYQRVYKWTTKNALEMIDDIFHAMEKSKVEYRLGTVILYCNNTKNEIVDGQQRIITIFIINELLKENTDLCIENNNTNISKVFYAIKEALNRISKEEFKKYFLEKCTLVKIIATNLAEAFQYFDSQNYRGKALLPHDLLKAYHYREENLSTELTEQIEEKWQQSSEDTINKLFSIYLYRINRWSLGKNGNDYSIKTKDLFKGIKDEQTNFFNFLLSSSNQKRFQIDSPFIAGKAFFEFVDHYQNLFLHINKVEEEKSHYRNCKGLYNLFIAVIMYYCDKFAPNDFYLFTKTNEYKKVRDVVFKYVFSFRLRQYSIYEKSINKIALGEDTRLIDNVDKTKSFYPINIFMLIRDDLSGKDIFSIESVPLPQKFEKYEKLLKELKGGEGNV